MGTRSWYVDPVAWPGFSDSRNYELSCQTDDCPAEIQTQSPKFALPHGALCSMCGIYVLPEAAARCSWWPALARVAGARHQPRSGQGKASHHL